jgi:carbamoyl-phosphate synthase small subunit
MLMLADGYVAHGVSIGAAGTTVGKLVFNTSMTGYQEILTDPSYAGEIIVFTFPLIGIYGAAEEDRQSSRIHARGLVCGELSDAADNWRADRALSDLLLLEGTRGIAGLDTRRLTRHLRDRGEMLGVITSELTEAEARALLAEQPDFGELDLVREVTCDAPYLRRAFEVYREDWSSQQVSSDSPVAAASLRPYFGGTDAAAIEPTLFEAADMEHRLPAGRPLVVAAYDFGIKRAILDCLTARGCEVHVFPATASADELLAVDPDGVFLSNGPGDPARMDYVLPHIQRLTETLPVFGICLGHQLLARAAGLPTYRLKFGNRGANHPVLELADNRVHISSQNHSYAVALGEGPEGMPAAAESKELPNENTVGKITVGAAASRPSVDVDKLPPPPATNRNPLGPDRPRDAYPHPLNPEVLVTHLNVNDSSNEGLSWRDRPVFSVQYHPEGCPGPRDNTYLFDRFIGMMLERIGG